MAHDSAVRSAIVEVGMAPRQPVGHNSPPLLLTNVGLNGK